jgi:hypothetical protein
MFRNLGGVVDAADLTGHAASFWSLLLALSRTQRTVQPAPMIRDRYKRQYA